jgi:hypothetical protein
MTNSFTNLWLWTLGLDPIKERPDISTLAIIFTEFTNYKRIFFCNGSKLRIPAICIITIVEVIKMSRCGNLLQGILRNMTQPRW